MSKRGNKPIFNHRYWRSKEYRASSVISIDWMFDISKAREKSLDKVSIQGNLDPIIHISKPETIVREAIKVLEKYGIGDRHIFNLGHGILPETPVENVKLLC